MRPEFSKFALWAAGVTGIICVLAMAVLTVQSLVRLFNATPDNENMAVAVPAVTESASPQQETKSFSDAGEQSPANPVPAPTTPANNEFCTDSKVIRQQEQERQESIDNFRRELSDNQSSNAVLPKGQLQQIEPPEIL